MLVLTRMMADQTFGSGLNTVRLAKLNLIKSTTYSLVSLLIGA